MNIYVGNLPYDITDESLSEAFTEFREASAARVITDRFSGRSRGFGFVEMANDEHARAAIERMNGKDMQGRYGQRSASQRGPRSQSLLARGSCTSGLTSGRHCDRTDGSGPAWRFPPSDRLLQASFASIGTVPV